MKKIKNIINYEPSEIEDVDFSKYSDIIKLKKIEFKNYRRGLFAFILITVCATIMMSCLICAIISNNMLAWSLCVCGFAGILLSSFLMAIFSNKSWKAMMERMELEKLRSADVLYHNFVCDKNIIVCYVSEIKDAICNVKILTEKDNEIKEHILLFSYKESDNVADLTLDIKEKAVLYKA